MGKDFVLDEKDRAILKLLLEDGRMPLTLMAPKVKLSHDAVKYRIEQMKKAGVITAFVPVINPAKIGLPIWGDVIFSLWNVTPERYAEWIKYLKYHPFVAAVWNLSGRFEWFVEIYTPDLAKFNEIVSETKMKFSDIIKDSETLFVLKEIKAQQLYPTNYPGI
jgi:DNA-binding Lrp family transcriptional regulator